MKAIPRIGEVYKPDGKVLSSEGETFDKKDLVFYARLKQGGLVELVEDEFGVMRGDIEKKKDGEEALEQDKENKKTGKYQNKGRKK